MTADAFRQLALDLPEAVESEHMGHPDFRVRGKVFATLGYPAGEWGMVKLTPELQEEFLDEAPDVFTPASGAWGRRGATMVRLGLARTEAMRRALQAAWRTVAPKRLAREHEGK